MTQHFNTQFGKSNALGPTTKGQTAALAASKLSPSSGVGATPTALTTPAATSPLSTPMRGTNGIGGTPAGSVGTVAQFGSNSLPGPFSGSSGALGTTQFQPNNPYANNLLPSSVPVNPNDPSANLFRTITPNGGSSTMSTPTPNAGTGFAGMGGVTPGPMVRPSPGGVPSMPATSGGWAGGAPGAFGMGGGAPGGMPQPMGPSGAPSGMPSGMAGGMQGQMSPLAAAGAGGSMGGGWARGMPMGGSPAPQIGGFNTPSLTLAQGNPASPYYLGSGASSGAAPSSGAGSAAPGAGSNGGMLGGNTMQGRNILPLSAPGGAVGVAGNGSLTPQQIAQLSTMTGMFKRGGAVRRYATGGAGTSDDPNVPGSGAEGAPAIASLIQQQAHRPVATSNPYAGSDPITQMILAGHNPVGGSPGGGDNGTASVLQRLALRPGVVRTGSTMPIGFAGGGSPLGMSAPASSHQGHIAGPSAGQDDDVNARLSDGEYVFDADTVSALGDGNTEAGARKLDEFRQNLRAHKRSAPPDKIPPKAKKMESYMPKGKKSAAKASAEAAGMRRR